MTRRALVRDDDGLVENVIIIGDDYQAPSGYSLLDIPEASKGDIWNGRSLVKKQSEPSDLDKVRDAWATATIDEKVKLLAKLLEVV